MTAERKQPDTPEKCASEAWYYPPYEKKPRTLRCRERAGHDDAHRAHASKFIGVLLWDNAEHQCTCGQEARAERARSNDE